MSQQSPRRSVFRMLLSILAQKVPEQAKQHVPPPRRPTGHAPAAWQAYWESLGQRWRTDPEIDPMRQADLARHRAIVPDIEKGIYPFTGMKLSRADVEWLLATHENGRGPVEWSDEHMWRRKRLDLRGADLRQTNLNNLPLTRFQGGLSQEERMVATPEQCEMAGVHLEGADLHWAHLERASLFGAYLAEANLSRAHLEETFLVGAHLERANLTGARLERSYLTEAHLEEAELFRAHLEGAFLNKVHLEKANLHEAHLEGAGLRLAHLEGAVLREAFFDPATNLERVILGQEKVGFASLADLRWGGTNLAVVNWGQMKILGDEYRARQRRQEGKDRNTRLTEYEAAARANRQLAIVLQTQGINEEAARFAYRAQVLQKHVFQFQILQPKVTLKQRGRVLGAWFFSWFLELIAGYGYKPGRGFLAYLLVISTFMALYLLLDPHLVWYEALVVSLTAFHGRGFSPSTFSPGDPLSIASAIEAFVGLIIEVTFIATLTRRFFGQ